VRRPDAEAHHHGLSSRSNAAEVSSLIMFWNALRAHGRQVDMFRHALQRGRTAHAYVFVGPEGVGKRLVARGIAQCLFCQRIPDERLEACGECPACRQVLANTHPDLLSVACPEGKRELPIALIAGADDRRGREGLLHDLSLRPMSATRRIAIIDDADAMNEESANALLKTLEEPPPGSLLLLISPSLDALLPTIRSRCQPMYFGPLAQNDVADLLIQLGWEADAQAAASVAALADGSLTTARQLLDPGLRKLRNELHTRLEMADFQSVQTSDAVVALIEELGCDSPAQREIASWVIQFAVHWHRDRLTSLVSGAEPSFAGWPALLARSGGDWKDAADRMAASIDRCVLADAQLAQMMPVPLCLEGLCHDLSRIRHSAFTPVA